MEKELEEKDYELNGELVDLLEERIEEVITMIANKKEWESAPFAELLGITENANHFVC